MFVVCIKRPYQKSLNIFLFLFYFFFVYVYTATSVSFILHWNEKTPLKAKTERKKYTKQNNKSISTESSLKFNFMHNHTSNAIC